MFDLTELIISGDLGFLNLFGLFGRFLLELVDEFSDLLTGLINIGFLFKLYSADLS